MGRPHRDRRRNRVDAGNQAWLNALWDLIVAAPAATDGYYENTLKLLAMVVMSRNWWAPERVAPGPCVAPTLTPTPSPTPTATSTPQCPPTPRADCRTPIAAGAALLSLKDQSDDAKDSLQWKWGKGAATTLTDLGDPTSTTRYDLCLYDGSAALVASAAAPAGPPRKTASGICRRPSRRTVCRASTCGAAATARPASSSRARATCCRYLRYRSPPSR